MSFLNKYFLLFACSTFCLTACNSIKDIEYLGVKEAKLQSLGIQKGTVKVILQYHNPNNFGIDLKETQLEVYANDTYVGVADSPEIFKVPKKSNFDFPVYVHFNPIKALGMVALLKTNMIKLHVKGTAKVGKGGVYIRVPVDVTEDVNLR